MESEDQQRMEQLQQEQLKIKEYLKTLPYQVLLKQRMENKKLAEHQQYQSNQKSNKNKSETSRGMEEQQPVKQKQKNTPIQRSAKIKVKRFVKVFDDKRRQAIDPRFQDYAGEYNQDAAKKAFKFIPELQQKQKQVLKKSLSSKKSKLSDSERQILSQRYNQVTSHIQLNKHRQLEKSVNKQHRKELSTQLKQGKTPFFKRKTIKKDDLQKKKFQGMSQYQRNKYVSDKQIRTRINFDNRKQNYQRNINHNRSHRNQQSN